MKQVGLRADYADSGARSDHEPAFDPGSSRHTATGIQSNMYARVERNIEPLEMRTPTPLFEKSNVLVM